MCLQYSNITECEPLTDPTNGNINCELGDNGVPTDGDTCSYTCNDGYELTGNEMRTCQSNGSWSGNHDVCSRGVLYVIIKLCMSISSRMLSEYVQHLLQ